MNTRGVEAKLRALETEAVATIKQKESDLRAAQSALSTAHETVSRAEATTRALTSEVAALKEANALLRVRTIEQENTLSRTVSDAENLRIGNERAERERERDKIALLQKFQQHVSRLCLSSSRVL
jgi:hypothetical protein